MIGKSVDYLMELDPKIPAEEYAAGKFRYLIQVSVSCSTGEMMAYKAKYAVMKIYLFANTSEIITRYEVERLLF